MNTLELQIILGRNCNFKCLHCINSSGPGQKGSDLTPQELVELAHLINLHQEVSHVSFSGGEPLLYLSCIRAIQSHIQRPVHYSITTNGSLITDKYEELNKLRIDHLLLSIDKFHLDFWNLNKLDESINLAKRIAAKVDVNIVYAQPADVTSLKDLLVRHELKVTLNRQIQSPRSNPETCETSSNSQFTCPNLNNGNLKKITYHPGEGLSICCGSLAFDKNIVRNGFYSLTINELSKLSLLTQVRQLTTAQSSRSSNQIPFYGKADCDNCHHYLSRPSSVLPSVFELLETKESASRTFPLDETLPSHISQHYIPMFHLKYVFVLENTARHEEQQTPSDDIEVIEMNPANPKHLDDFKEFVTESFYQRHTHRYSEADRQYFLNECDLYFSLNTRTYFYYHRSTLFGCLSLAEISDHPFLKRKAWHVGYWGTTGRTSSKSLRSSVKRLWLDNIKQLCGDDSVCISNVDYFNKPALGMARDFGMKLTAVRLDIRL